MQEGIITLLAELVDMNTIPLVCHQCNLSFTRDIVEYRKKLKRFGSNPDFCSRKCFVEYRSQDRNAFLLHCSQCNQAVKRTPHTLNDSKSGNHFCSTSCSAKFNNRLKRKSRRSKCEQLLFSLLQNQFPLLKIFSNDKLMLEGFEVDIAIPELNVAIEWNGIVHFKPIYGISKLDKVQERDRLKQEISQRKGVELIIVTDLVSTPKKVQEAFEEIKCRIEFLLTKGD